ncbi:uncharacterized protein LOC110750058 isoform X2 [Prunus avium]|uniref:Uncharacterized protein LOC110750058 isoform X2 n=1 Tax=Prunus avium TaxID=42229 RepID=A0A6P5RY00_PRUAV|nr:uncharacterized protein LOC110750058 isoform X2 [Prunus avium]
MASSKKWASIISSIASCVYFLVIILQVPLFRVPCTAGICRTPIEVTSSQLIACELFPLVVVKALLYPGAFANALIKNRSIPSYDSLKLYKFTNVKAADAISELQRLEVLLPNTDKNATRREFTALWFLLEATYQWQEHF